MLDEMIESDEKRRNITQWMDFIRPHISNYERAAPGDRKRYLEDVSKEFKIGERNLRRFIAAAQYLARRGISEFPGRMPVAAVENIMRIGQYDPLYAKNLLHSLVAGKVTVNHLINQLKMVKEGAPLILHDRLGEKHIAQALADLPRPEGKRAPSAGTFYEFTYSSFDETLFDEVARPSGFTLLSDGRTLIILDESLAAWDVSPRRVILAFLASAAVALTIADLVLVCTTGLEDKIIKWKESMVEPAKSRLLVLRGRLVLKWEDPITNFFAPSPPVP